jgi:hypothetical protein
VFAAPVGYRYETVEGRGRMLVRDEPLASIIQEALEGYASGRFQLQVEVRRFLASHPEYPRDRRGALRAQRVTDLLKRPIYAGYGKSIRRAAIEGEFEPLLHELRPVPEMFSAAPAMSEDLWNHRLATAEARRSCLKIELTKVERDVEQFLDRIANAQLPSVITPTKPHSRSRRTPGETRTPDHLVRSLESIRNYLI